MINNFKKLSCKLKTIESEISSIALQKEYHIKYLDFKNRFLTNIFSRNLCLILGCQRSGTTLTYSIISSHDSIVGLDEDESYFELPGWPLLALNFFFKKYTVFKLPTKCFSVGQINSHYKHAKIIWMVRSPLAVVSSMKSLKVNENEGNWLKEYSAKELSLAKELFPNIETSILLSDDPTARGAYLWKYKTLALEFIKEKKANNVFVLKYEDLLASNESELKKLLNFLGLRWDHKISSYWKFQERTSRIGKTSTDRPINKDNLFAPLNLTKEEKQTVLQITNSLARSYGYKQDIENDTES